MSRCCFFFSPVRKNELALSVADGQSCQIDISTFRDGAKSFLKMMSRNCVNAAASTENIVNSRRTQIGFSHCWVFQETSVSESRARVSK